MTVEPPMELRHYLICTDGSDVWLTCAFCNREAADGTAEHLGEAVQQAVQHSREHHNRELRH